MDLRTLCDQKWRIKKDKTHSLRGKSPYSEFFWSVFSRIQSECGKIRTSNVPNKFTFHTVIALPKIGRICKACNFIKKQLQHRCFSVNIAKLLSKGFSGGCRSDTRIDRKRKTDWEVLLDVFKTIKSKESKINSVLVIPQWWFLQDYSLGRLLVFRYKNYVSSRLLIRINFISLENI